MCLNKKLLMSLYKYRRKANEIAYPIFQSRQQQQRLTHSASASPAATRVSPKVLFFGTDTFSLPSLVALHKNNASQQALGVVTSFKSPVNCVRLFAEQHRLPLHRWPISSDVCHQYDLGVVVSFGHLVPERLIKSFPLGMINVHASLLPRWRGAAPIIYAIMHGDSTTGVSIMRIEPKHFDIGDILAQREVPIPKDAFMPQLHAQLAKAGAQLLVEVINGFPQSFQNAKKQNEADATFAPKITSVITEINWADLTAEQLFRRFRALYSYKHLSTRFMDKSIQLLDLRPSVDIPTVGKQLTQSGAFVYQKETRCLLVRCAHNSFIEVHQLRIEGKKAMSAMDFNNGFLKKQKNVELTFVGNKMAQVSC